MGYPSEVKADVNDRPVAAQLKRNYLWFEQLKPGDVASVRYELPLTSRDYVLGNDRYTATFKGDTAISVTPPGPYMPLYRRNRYSADTAPETEQLWHLPDREIASL